MPGDYEAKFANLRTFYGYMIPSGQKTAVHSQEFGQFIEWDEKQPDWMLLAMISTMNCKPTSRI